MTETIFEFLDFHAIHYIRADHPPVFTCAEARRLVPALAGAETKNLFLRDGKGRRHFLVSVAPEKNVDLRSLGQKLGVSGLSFASADRLKRYLNLEPGSVTLLGVINDTEYAVELIIDRDLWGSDAFLCHPLVNTSTLVMEKSELCRFFELTGHQCRILEIPGAVRKVLKPG